MYLVTGGAGFVGSALVRALTRAGAPVRACDIQPLDGAPPEVETVRGDLTDRAVVRRVLRGVQAVYHCAVAVSAMISRRRLMRENYDPLTMLLEECVSHDVEQLVLISSSSVYGKVDRLPIDEDTPARPTDAYGQVRLDMEEMALAFAPHRLIVTVLRPHIVLGPGRVGIVKGLLQQMESGGVVYLPASVRARHQVLHVDDLVEVCMQATLRRQHGLYHVGAPVERSVLQFLQDARQRLNPRTRLCFIPDLLLRIGGLLERRLGLALLGPNKALMSPRGFYFDCRRAEADLGFAPRFSEAECWQTSLEWYIASQNHQNESRAWSPSKLSS